MRKGRVVPLVKGQRQPEKTTQPTLHTCSDPPNSRPPHSPRILRIATRLTPASSLMLALTHTRSFTPTSLISSQLAPSLPRSYMHTCMRVCGAPAMLGCAGSCRTAQLSPHRSTARHGPLAPTLTSLTHSPTHPPARTHACTRTISTSHTRARTRAHT